MKLILSGLLVVLVGLAMVAGCISDTIEIETPTAEPTVKVPATVTEPTRDLITNATWTNTTGRYYVAGGGGALPKGYTVTPFNQTACDEGSKMYGKDCTCFTCGPWVADRTQGFYNLSGFYNSDGTPTGKTFSEMEKEATDRSNLEYNSYMNSKGCFYRNNKWDCY